MVESGADYATQDYPSIEPLIVNPVNLPRQRQKYPRILKILTLFFAPPSVT